MKEYEEDVKKYEENIKEYEGNMKESERRSLQQEPPTRNTERSESSREVWDSEQFRALPPIHVQAEKVDGAAKQLSPSHYYSLVLISSHTSTNLSEINGSRSGKSHFSAGTSWHA